MIRNRQLTLVSVQKPDDLMTHGEKLKIKKKENLRIAFWSGSRLKNKRDFQGVSGAEPLEELRKTKKCASNNSLPQPFSFCFSPFLFFFFCVSLVFLSLSISLFLSFQFSFPPRVLLPLTSQLLPLRLHIAIQNKKPLFLRIHSAVHRSQMAIMKR